MTTYVKTVGQTALILSLLVLTGCSKSSTEQGVVSGEVTAINPKTKKKTTLPVGTITFVNVQSQKRVMGAISNGNYSVSGIEPGMNKVIIASAPPIPNEVDPDNPTAQEKKKTKWVRVPDKYSSIQETPLSANVKAGAQRLAFDVK